MGFELVKLELTPQYKYVLLSQHKRLLILAGRPDWWRPPCS